MRRYAGCVVVGVLCSLMTGGISAAGENATVDSSRETIVQHLTQDRHSDALSALRSYLKRRPNDGAMLYNAACAAAQLQELNEAETYLRRAVAAGFLRFSHMRRDADLAPLRSRPVYRAIMQARQAADSIYQQRRIKSWRQRLNDDYVLVENVIPTVDVLTALDETRRHALQDRMRFLVESFCNALFEAPPGESVLVVHVTRSDAARIFDNQHIHGTYRHEARELVTLDAGRSLQHELVHALHHAHMDRLHQHHPIWLVEGLATLAEAYQRTADVSIRFLPNDRTILMQRLVQQNETIALSRLLALRESEFLSDPAVHYAHVRSLFRFLAAENKLNALYDSYTTSYASDPSGALALRRTFGESLHAIERDWHEWIATVREGNEPPDRESRIIAVSQRAPQPPSDIDAQSDEQRAVDAHQHVSARFTQLMDQHAHGDYASMIQPLREIVETQPTFADARYKLGLAYAATGNLDGLRRQCNALRELDPSLASLLSNLMKQPASLK